MEPKKKNHRERLRERHGRGNSKLYVKAGADVVGMDIDTDLGQTVTANANKNNEGKSSFLRVDIGDPQSVADAFTEASKLLGGLDALAHPAAIHSLGDPSTIFPEDWDRMFSINVRGTMLTNQQLSTCLKKQEGDQ